MRRHLVKMQTRVLRPQQGAGQHAQQPEPPVHRPSFVPQTTSHLPGAKTKFGPLPEDEKNVIESATDVDRRRTNREVPR
jgi:hypothetical protein